MRFMRGTSGRLVAVGGDGGGAVVSPLVESTLAELFGRVCSRCICVQINLVKRGPLHLYYLTDCDIE
jgi:hypothetical protein